MIFCQIFPHKKRWVYPGYTSSDVYVDQKHCHFLVNKYCIFGWRPTLYFYPPHPQPTWTTLSGFYLSLTFTYPILQCTVQQQMSAFPDLQKLLSAVMIHSEAKWIWKKELSIIRHCVVQLIIYFASLSLHQARSPGQQSWLIPEPRAALLLS